MQNQTYEQAVIETVDSFREEMLGLEKRVMNLKKSLSEPNAELSNGDKGEAIANVMLAYRHLEDARMRMGKVLQAINGGVSVYDAKK